MCMRGKDLQLGFRTDPKDEKWKGQNEPKSKPKTTPRTSASPYQVHTMPGYKNNNPQLFLRTADWYLSTLTEY